MPPLQQPHAGASPAAGGQAAQPGALPGLPASSSALPVLPPTLQQLQQELQQERDSHAATKAQLDASLSLLKRVTEANAAWAEASTQQARQLQDSLRHFGGEVADVTAGLQQLQQGQAAACPAVAVGGIASTSQSAALGERWHVERIAVPCLHGLTGYDAAAQRSKFKFRNDALNVAAEVRPVWRFWRGADGLESSQRRYLFMWQDAFVLHAPPGVVPSAAEAAAQLKTFSSRLGNVATDEWRRAVVYAPDDPRAAQLKDCWGQLFDCCVSQQSKCSLLADADFEKVLSAVCDPPCPSREVAACMEVLRSAPTVAQAHWAMWVNFV